MQLGKLRYGLSGISGRFNQTRACPDCNSAKAQRIDIKGFHGLYRCQQCHINYRFPSESPETMARFYQHDYASNSMATDVPDENALQRLRTDGLANTPYERPWHLRVYQQLGLFPGCKVVDFGTSWGYFTLQLKHAGFDACGFEISKPRAAIGAKLGVEIYSDESAIPKPLDAVCSTHVIEHVPKPIEKLRQMLNWVKPGGVVMGYTPNGGAAAQRANPQAFHSSWGMVHPVLLAPESISRAFPEHALIVTSDDSEENLAKWRGHGRQIDRCDGMGLLFAVRRQP